MAWARPGLCYRKAVQLAHSKPTSKLRLETRCLVHWRRNNCLTVSAHIYHCLKQGLWYQAILSPIVQSSVLQRHGLKTVLVSCYCQRVVQSSMHQRPGLNARIWVSGYCQTVVHIGVGRGGARGATLPPPIIWEGGPIYPLPPPNIPPTFSFNFYVKQEKITNVPSWTVK